MHGWTSHLEDDNNNDDDQHKYKHTAAPYVYEGVFVYSVVIVH